MIQSISMDTDLDGLDILPILLSQLGFLYLSIQMEAVSIFFILFERIESLKIQPKLSILLAQ